MDRQQIRAPRAQLSAALAYASAGVPVLPLHTPTARSGCSCRTRGCSRPGKHPRIRDWPHAASNDLDVIRRWWLRWPDANVGLRTGVVMDVCDIDTPQAAAVLARQVAADLPALPMARTGAGGWHLWWAPTGLGNRAGLLPGVDWRGAGGYVVAPPSLHATGRRYRWLRPGLPTGELTTLPRVPAVLLDLLQPGPHPLHTSRAEPEPPASAIAYPTRYGNAALVEEATAVATARAGVRNTTLYRAARSLGELVAAGVLNAHTVTTQLLAAADTCQLPYPEAAATIRSGLNAGARRPRNLTTDTVRTADSSSRPRLVEPPRRASG